MKAILLHLGTNLWYDFESKVHTSDKLFQCPADHKMRFDNDFFHEYTEKLAKLGFNTIVLDLADGVVYNSHPEIAVEGAWSVDQLKREIERLNKMGITVMPKLNFSTTHDVWLGDYARMVSTPIYYKVCRDLIDEVCEIFKPEYLHIGMDEETYDMQRLYDYVTVRQNDLWWHDLYYFVECVERHGARACMWSDYARHKPDEYVEKCPKSVVQCTWYYFNEFYGDLDEHHRIRVYPFHIIEKHGFDQFPTASYEYFKDNVVKLHEFCEGALAEERYLGIMQTAWVATTEAWRKSHEEAAEIAATIWNKD